ncbi:LysR family transcriptional regulator [Bordetella sp. BOR01]|uniref:LysR family transcriptional regulator n=1 Tax=Bordetella sp. BOR01 TaxID=2854779 RepID=UPI001C46007D|nr:LysR family transcriptional regulator [Bordetella sp. BOR01]MBV7486558.1 LysR family transcriptional regulator [Bordetella sp. BOR01]
MSFDLADLRLIRQLVDAGSLSEAARRVQSSPAVMSRRLSALETRLGTRLFHRSSRQFMLTQEGAMLHERALAVLESVAEIEAEIAAVGTVPQGLLRIGAPMQIGRRRIAPVVGDFARQYPEVAIQLMLSDTGFSVIDDALDVAVRAGLPDDPDIVVRRLLSSRRLICATPEYLARHGTPRVPEDLLRHNCIRLMRRRGAFDPWLFKYANGEIRSVQVSGPLMAASGEVMYDWIVQGRGIGQKALWDVEEDLRVGRLVECLADYACHDISLYATWRARPHLPLRLRKFIDYLAQAFEAT